MTDFPRGWYKTVVIDPPWRLGAMKLRLRPFTSKADLPYPTMSLEELEALPVRNILARDAWLFVWCTQKSLPLAIRLLFDWGAKYRWTMVWHKSGGGDMRHQKYHGSGGTQPFGCPKFNCEFVVTGARGSPKLDSQKNFPALFKAPVRGHSIKPAEFYEIVQRCCPGPRIDLFARRYIPGFEGWGDQLQDSMLEGAQIPMFPEETP